MAVLLLFFLPFLHRNHILNSAKVVDPNTQPRVIGIGPEKPTISDLRRLLNGGTSHT
jgi:hypothetical protein